MSNIAVTVTETIADSVTVTSNEVVVTTNTSVGTAADTPCNPVGIITATNLQDAIHQLADQHFVQPTAPAAIDTNLQEGDVWYNTTDNKLMIYRNTTWEEIIVSAQLSESSDTSEYSDVTLNGGYF